MLGPLFLLLVLLPVVEIVLLVWVGMHTSALFVLGMLVAIGIGGAALARHQGMQTLRRISAETQAGRMPADALLDGVLVLLAGVLLVLPGFLTDVAALIFLFPPSRRVVKALIRRRLQVRVAPSGFTNFRADDFRGDAHDEIIDVKVIESPRDP